MNYQNILCVGDSQTFGARTYGCYPLYLAQILSTKTPYQWRTINRSTNGYTARDLWFMLNREIDTIDDTFQACLLIGTNDCGENKDCNLFEEYYRQILRMFAVKHYRAVFCGEIPPIYPDGHIFFSKATIERRERLNHVIEKVVSEFPQAYLVKMEGLSRDCYEDPVHFNEKGNLLVAEAFSTAIQKL